MFDLPPTSAHWKKVIQRVRLPLEELVIQIENHISLMF